MEKCDTEKGKQMSNKTNEQKKQELAARVTAAVSKDETVALAAAKDLKSKGEHQQRRKCSICKKSYLGQQNSSTCSDKCRQQKSRG